MTIEISYERDKTGCCITAIGRVTGKDIIEADKKVISDKCFKKLKYWLIDRTHCTEYLPTPEELIKIAGLDNSAAKENPGLLVAIVSVTDLQFGMTRLYNSYIDENGFKTCLLRTKEEAERWLERELNK